MHTIGISSKGYINSVVDDEQSFCPQSQVSDCPRPLQELACCRFFVPQLDGTSASCNCCFRYVNMRPAGVDEPIGYDIDTCDAPHHVTSLLAELTLL
jgi:hypothetical protein